MLRKYVYIGYVKEQLKPKHFKDNELEGLIMEVQETLMIEVWNSALLDKVKEILQGIQVANTQIRMHKNILKFLDLGKNSLGAQ